MATQLRGSSHRWFPGQGTSFLGRSRNGHGPTLVEQIDFRKGSVITVTRKTLQARSEQALVVIILSTGALIAYFGLALSRM